MGRRRSAKEEWRDWGERTEEVDEEGDERAQEGPGNHVSSVMAVVCERKRKE